MGYNSVAIIIISLADVAFQICEIPRYSATIQAYSSSRSPTFIDLGANRKRICNFLLVINNTFRRIFYRFRDIDAFSSKIACFLTPPLFDAPSGATPCDINAIYTSRKSTFRPNALQFRC